MAEQYIVKIGDEYVGNSSRVDYRGNPYRLVDCLSRARVFSRIQDASTFLNHVSSKLVRVSLLELEEIPLND